MKGYEWAAALLLACSAAACSTAEAEGESMRLAYGEQGLVELTGSPPGISATLARDVPVEFAWETRAARAVDLELQIQVAQLGGIDITDFSGVMRWQVWSQGHGASNFDPPPSGSSGTQRVPEWPIPARGVRVRLSARQLRIAVIAAGVGAAGASPIVRASVQPVTGAHVPIFPTTDNSRGFGGGWFPPGANEFRVRGVPPTDNVLLFLADGSTLLSSEPSTAYADWTPIPINAGSWDNSGTSTGEAIYR